MSGPNFGDVVQSMSAIMTELRKFPLPIQKNMVGFITETLLGNIPQAGERQSVPPPRSSALTQTPAARGMAAGTPKLNGA